MPSSRDDDGPLRRHWSGWRRRRPSRFLGCLDQCVNQSLWDILLQYIACLNFIQFTYDSGITILEVVVWLTCAAGGSTERNPCSQSELHERCFVDRRSMELNNQKARRRPNLDPTPNFWPKLKPTSSLPAGWNVRRERKIFFSSNCSGEPPNRQLVPNEKSSTRRNQESRKVRHPPCTRSEKLGKALNSSQPPDRGVNRRSTFRAALRRRLRDTITALHTERPILFGKHGHEVHVQKSNQQEPQARHGPKNKAAQSLLQILPPLAEQEGSRK